MDFNKNNDSSVTRNPLPNHAGPKSNAIMEDSVLKVKTKVDEVKASMEEIYEVLTRIGVIPKKEVFEKEKERQDCFVATMWNVPIIPFKIV